MSQILRDARQYEELREKKIARKTRPTFHLSPRVGWMNDPNGFSYYKGEYHMFYQYHPFDAHWGPMHWGHAVTKDFIKWEYRSAALAPDEEYDRFGCFSGSAIALPDGRQLLMYTGVNKKRDEEGREVDVQAQCLAVGDGVNYEKVNHNPVLDASDVPEGGSNIDFRDPKIWQEADGTYRCVVGNRPADGSGQILLYTSEDGFQWKFKKVLIENKCRYGKMWECPDFFELDGKQVLLTSPQDMLPEGLEYHNGNGTVCVIGTYDKETENFTEECNQAIDYGIDFYAPQTVLTEDGRRVMIGWMQNWDTSMQHPKDTPWFGQMSLPRELSIRDNRLIQKPIRELETLRKEKVEYHDVLVSGEVRLDGLKGRKIDMELTVKPVDKENFFQKFAVRFAQDEKHQTAVSFRPAEKIVKIDRKFSGSRRALIHQRRSYVNCPEGELKMRIILDRFSAEVFFNDGEYVMTATFYTPQEADGISFYADGEAVVDIVKYDLEG